MSSTLWRHIHGRFHSVSVADKNSIWGVTLDLQLCKFHVETQGWRLVSVASESVNRPHLSTASAQSAVTSDTLSNPTPYSSSVAALFPILRQQWESSAEGRDSSPSLPYEDSGSLSDYDSESDTTILVSAASDGTVVRLDKNQRSWYLVPPHGHVDCEKKDLWVDLGQTWKCVRYEWNISDSKGCNDRSSPTHLIICMES